MPTLRLVPALAALLALSGCVVHVKESDFDSREASWQKVERQNRAAIAALSTGMPIDEVRGRLGSPDFSESFRVEDREHVVLFYRTQRVHADSMTTREETTPLVFADGRLIGWGTQAWSQVTDRPLSGRF